MRTCHTAVMIEALNYFGNDRRRINHLMKVNTFSMIIGNTEGLTEETLNILDIASILHDIGIKISEEKYGSNEGKYQEKEGPAVAEQLLKKLNCSQDVIDRVKYLIGHHHTYTNIEGLDYQILVEADFLVNLDEDHASENAVKAVREKIFRTDCGTKLLDAMFL